MKIKELFEILIGNSKIDIQWEHASNKSIGYFTLDNKIVYGIRKILVNGETINQETDIVFIDFGWFENGQLNYELIGNSLYPTSVLNAVYSVIKEELLANKIIIFVAKQNSESEEIYKKRFSFYDNLVQLRARKYNYQAIQFENEENEIVFCLSKHKLPGKLEILKLCNKFNDEGWLSFSNAKRVITSLKRVK